jgi:hypothetical protein
MQSKTLFIRIVYQVTMENVFPKLYGENFWIGEGSDGVVPCFSMLRTPKSVQRKIERGDNVTIIFCKGGAPESETPEVAFFLQILYIERPARDGRKRFVYRSPLFRSLKQF